MSNSMENGHSNYNGEAEQVWERPWTLHEMQKTSSNWSLAADAGLFLYLQDFSQRMMSKTHEIEKQLDGLIRDTKATDSCLHTVFNDFLMLSNTQFIENRVYDEEVEDPAPKTEAQEKHPEQEKTREQKEAELIPKVQEAVNYGLKVLESAFEQLDIKAGNSDSEDEEVADRVEPILEPKDLYVDRPLPYLIGSQAFMEQDDVGLGDLSSDEMSIDSDRESVIESEEGKDEEHSDEDFDQEEEGQGSLKKKQSLVSYEEEEEEDEDSDIFGESDKDEDEARKDDVGQTSFADELAARIKGDTTSKPDVDRTSLSSGPSVSKKKNKGKKLPKASVEDDKDALFKPPKMEDDEYSPFGGKGGLFSGGKGLFDDDDDEGDLFSDAPKNKQTETEKEKIVPQTTEIAKTRKIPTGAVSIFPENSLFGSPSTSDSLESKANDSPVKPKMQATSKPAAIGGGLFDDDDDEDADFFSGKAPKKPISAGQEKQKPKKSVDLFGGDDDDDDDDEGDIFSGKSRVATTQQSKKSVEEEEVVQTPEKKLPAGAVSMFGPGTKNLLVEGLKKRQPSISEESEKSEESAPPPEVKPLTVHKTAEKVQSKSLFSDDEDSQIFSTVPKSQSKPEQTLTQSKPNKTSIFDDEEEEDLFSSIPKSKSIQVKTAALQPKKTVSSTLFSDDEDQWISHKPSTVKPEIKSGGMKASISAPSRLPSAKTAQKDSLFDEDDDLLAATKETSHKKSQRVSLLFEDEDEDKGSLFGFKHPENKTTLEAKGPAASSQAPSLFDPEESKKAAPAPIEHKVTEERSLHKKPVQTTLSTEEISVKDKPAAAVGLFGRINVLGDGAETTKMQTKSPLDDFDDLDWHKETPPPMENKEKKAKKNTLSLFDDDDDIDDEEEPDEASPVSVATKSTENSTEQKPRVKSTGVFQDEELLFSQTQQRDNDPDVDLFATTAKTSAPLPSSVKSAVPTLFGDDEDDDDLFSSAKPKAPPRVPEKPSKPTKDEANKGAITSQSTQKEKPASPVKTKETTTRIGKLQANLSINPASLLPGAAPRVPGAVSVISGLAPSSSAQAAGPLPGFTSIPQPQAYSEGGVCFDKPVQVTTLQNANKDRVKGATRRRPQTRAARQLSAQRSIEARGDIQEENSTPQAVSRSGAPPSVSPFNPVSVRPSALSLPVTTTSTAPACKQANESVRPKKPSVAAEEDLFASEDLFTSVSVPKHTASPQPKTKISETVPEGDSKREASVASMKDKTLSIFDDHGEDLFATVKTKPVKKAKAVPFLDDDDDDDIFRTEKRKDTKVLSDSTKPDIFQDGKETPPKSHKKPKDSSLDASLFDDVDIFADLTPVSKPKGKKVKKKVETKSIFDDDMDDIFSSGTTKSVAASSSKSKKPTQEPSTTEQTGHSIFDDPLNAFGRK